MTLTSLSSHHLISILGKHVINRSVWITLDHQGLSVQPSCARGRDDFQTPFHLCVLALLCERLILPTHTYMDIMRLLFINLFKFVWICWCEGVILRSHTCIWWGELTLRLLFINVFLLCWCGINPPITHIYIKVTLQVLFIIYLSSLSICLLSWYVG